MLVILLVILVVIALVANATKLVHVSNVLRNLRYSTYLCVWDHMTKILLIHVSYNIILFVI